MDNSNQGILVINKPAGITSHDVVNKVRKLYSTKQVGHTGTLDPMATGVLVVLVGRAVKASEFITSDKKRYLATLKLGMETDTEDITGEIINISNDIPSQEKVINAVQKFVGEIKQIPPMYSALKINGQKLVDLARNGQVVDREERLVSVYSINTTKLSDTQYSLDVECSKGTYIRTLCADIGKELGCGAVMETLERTQNGPFNISSSYKLEDIENMTTGERYNLLLPLENYFDDYAYVKLDDFFYKLSRNGAEVYIKKLGISLFENTKVKLYTKDGFYGIGQVMNYPDGLAIKTLKLFKI